MPIALESPSRLISTGFASGAVYTWNHSCTGGDRLLVVSVQLWQDVAGAGTVTALTFDGAAMTKREELTTGAMRAEIWYMLNPPTGLKVISLTVTGDTDDRKFCSAAYSGVSAIDASNNATGGTGDPTVVVTTVADNCWVQDAVAKFGTTATTVGAGQAALMRDVTGATLGAASFEGPKTPAGAVTMSWTNASANDWSAVAMSFSPVATPAPAKVAWLRA